MPMTSSWGTTAASLTVILPSPQPMSRMCSFTLSLSFEMMGMAAIPWAVEIFS